MTRTTLLLIAGLVVASGGFYYVVAGDSDADEPVASADDGAARGSRRAPPRRDDARPRSSSSDSGDLERRVAALEKELRTVKAQLRMQRGAITLSGSGSRDDDLEDAVFGESGGGGGGVFEERVRDVLEEERAEERERRDERRRERVAERNTEALASFAAVAGVAASVQTDIGNLWTGESEQLMEIIRQAREGDRDWQAVRDDVQKLREETDASAKELLTEEQYAEYLNHRPQGGPGGRGGRWGRDGGGGGGRE